LCCDPSLIAQATPKRPYGQGKARLLINFKDQGAAAAAAAAAFRASTNRTRAVLDLKRTVMQNARVSLAIQLQRVAREVGHQQATFRAGLTDGMGWDFIAFKEPPTAAPMAYPFIHHFPGVQPPAQGFPYISVDTATVTELLKRLRPLNSFPKHVRGQTAHNCSTSPNRHPCVTFQTPTTSAPLTPPHPPQPLPKPIPNTGTLADTGTLPDTGLHWPF